MLVACISERFFHGFKNLYLSLSLGYQTQVFPLIQVAKCRFDTRTPSYEQVLDGEGFLFVLHRYMGWVHHFSLIVMVISGPVNRAARGRLRTVEADMVALISPENWAESVSTFEPS